MIFYNLTRYCSLKFFWNNPSPLVCLRSTKTNDLISHTFDQTLFYMACQLFSEEILTGEFFATGLYKSLDEYQILLAIASIIYEPRINHKFKTEFKNDQLRLLRKTISSNEFLSNNKKFDELSKMTTMIKPIYDGKSFFDVLERIRLGFSFGTLHNSNYMQK